ncbi:SagB/ThcOx family dehydrogenase [Streptomyces viridochromogenes]|uniref:SagB/ThcOx family dehydrogenase n=1 Tax=Streptomyces viridochromogenes TaxID=1938 RepID=UPI0022771838|nr:SagB/ThcOx family dehydrogenase [Streptomyces viridochromogenes]
MPRGSGEPSRRRGARSFLAGPIALAELADCLDALRQEDVDGLAKCRYPSGGGLHPVQTYLYVEEGAVSGLTAGTYYLDPREHALVTLAEGATLDTGVHAAHNRAVFEGAGFAVFLVADLDAIEPLYGPPARDLCLPYGRRPGGHRRPAQERGRPRERGRGDGEVRKASEGG